MEELYVTRHENVNFKQPPNGILDISKISVYEKYYIVKYNYYRTHKYKFDIYNADNEYITWINMESMYNSVSRMSIYSYTYNHKIVGDYFVNWDKNTILITSILNRGKYYFVPYRIDSEKDTGIHHITDIIYINDAFYYCLTHISYKKYMYKLQLSYKKDARKNDNIIECLDLDYTGLNIDCDIDDYAEYIIDRQILLTKLDDKLVNCIPIDKDTYLVIIWNLGKTKLTIYRYEYLKIGLFPNIKIYNNLISISCNNNVGLIFISLDKTIIYSENYLPGEYIGLTNNNYLIMNIDNGREIQIINIQNKQCILKFLLPLGLRIPYYITHINNQLNIHMWKTWSPDASAITYHIKTKKELLIRYTTLFRGLNMQLIYIIASYNTYKSKPGN